MTSDTGDPWRLDGRVALVTGAGRGLGRGCALELARAGAHVVIVSRTAAELEQVAAEIRAITDDRAVIGEHAVPGGGGGNGEDVITSRGSDIGRDVITSGGSDIGKDMITSGASDIGKDVITGGRGSGERAVAAEDAVTDRQAVTGSSGGGTLGDAVPGTARVTTLVADVRNEAAVNEVVAAAAALGELAVLVTAAGTNRTGPARDYSVSDWDLLFDLNVRASFIACRAFGRNLLDRGVGGAIVMMSSQMGSVGYPGRVAYCSSKHAVDGMTKALAVEWARDGIRVNAVAPTFVDTPLTRPMLADPEFREEILERRLPTGRLARVEDVARAVRYLACDASANVTGHILKVDGGWTAW